MKKVQLSPTTQKPKELADRGLFVGESKGNKEYKIDRGGHYLQRAGFEPSTVPIGSVYPEKGGCDLLEGVCDDLVRQTIHGNYTTVPVTSLWGKSVALLFSSGNHPKCTSFIPFLIQFYKSINESGAIPKIEIIYIGLENSKDIFEQGRKSMPWLSIQYNSPLRQDLIKRYRFKVEPPATISPGTITIGIPKLLVVGPRGEEMHWLPCDHQSATVLREWDFFSLQWQSPQQPVTLANEDSCALETLEQVKKSIDSELCQTTACSWPLSPRDAKAWPLELERQQRMESSR